MKPKIFCPVCLVAFNYREPLAEGDRVICPVCGARLEIEVLIPELKARRVSMAPEEEIRDRIENYARLKGYTFNDNKEEVVKGLLDKHKKYGDFYCPCRFDNTAENICPCLDTRRGQVRREGSCL